MIKLVLLRHGESQWNLENRFTGWTDVDLTAKGELEAKTAGKVLKENLFEFDLVYTSVLQRAIKTMEICLSEMGIDNIPINMINFINLLINVKSISIFDFKIL